MSFNGNCLLKRLRQGYNSLDINVNQQLPNLPTMSNLEYMQLKPNQDFGTLTYHALGKMWRLMFHMCCTKFQTNFLSSHGNDTILYARSHPMCCTKFGTNFFSVQVMTLNIICQMSSFCPLFTPLPPHNKAHFHMSVVHFQFNVR